MIDIKTIAKDIKNGDNIDIYVTIAVSLALTMLNIVSSLFDMNITTSLGSLNIGILTLIAITMLVNRNKFDNLCRSIVNHDKGIIEENFPKSYAFEISTAREIIQTGVHISSKLNEYYSDYREMLEAGGKFKVLIADPDGKAIQMAALRFPGYLDAESEVHRAKQSLAVLVDLMKDFPSVEIRSIDYLFERSVTIIDGDKPSCMVYEERYTFRTRGGAKKPKLIYNKSDGEWFDLTKSEVNYLWNISKPLEAKNL